MSFLYIPRSIVVVPGIFIGFFLFIAMLIALASSGSSSDSYTNHAGRHQKANGIWVLDAGCHWLHPGDDKNLQFYCY